MPWRKGNEPHFYAVGEWAELEDVHICVHELFEAVLTIKQKDQRLIYANVEYRNGTDQPFGYRLNQWRLHDREGYSHKYAMGEQYFEPLELIRISENRILPYKTVRGWIVFPVSNQVEPDHLHFQEHYGSKARCADFQIGLVPFTKINREGGVACGHSRCSKAISNK